MQPIVHEGGAELLPCPTDFLCQTHAVLSLPFQADNEHLLYSSHTPTIEKLLREAGLEAVRPEHPGVVRYRDERSLQWLGPILFFSAAALAQNPQIVSISLGVISNLVTELFRGRSEAATAKLSIIEELEAGKRYRRVEYNGTADGIRALSAPIRATYAGTTENK